MYIIHCIFVSYRPIYMCVYISANAASISAKCSVRVDITDYKTRELLGELLCIDLTFMWNFSKIRLLFQSFESDTQKCIKGIKGTP